MEPGGSLDLLEAVGVYQKGYVARLTEALGETFEAVWWVLGDDLFFNTCVEYIKTHESHSYNLSHYGKDFYKLLRKTTSLKTFVFLPELAQFEWLFQEIFHRRQHESLSQKALTQIREGEDFILYFAEAVSFVKYSTQVFNIWKMRRNATDKVVDMKLDQGQFLVLYKLDDQVCVKELKETVWHLLNVLNQKKSFLQSIQICSEKEIDLTEDDIRESFQFIAVSGICISRESQKLH